MNQVRRADMGDIPAILHLLVQVDMVHHRARPDLFKGPATKYTDAELRLLLADPMRPVFVCVDEKGQVLGHAFCAFKQFLNDTVMTDVKSLYIDDLCVDEQIRGRGVGKTLYDHVVRFARENGCYNVTLNVWAGNDAALSFYRRQGMQPQKYGMETIL